MKYRLFVFPVLFLVIASAAMAAEKVPAPPASKAKCPVCGMFVAKYRDWLASITFMDRTTLYFDGPKDMFRFYLNPEKFGSKKKQGDVASIFVNDYYSLTPVDGRSAYYVIGSDVLGPMGKELVPFARRSDAEGFLKDHGGRRVLRFGDVTPTVVRSLE